MAYETRIKGRLEAALGYRLNRPQDAAFANWFESRSPKSLEVLMFMLKGIGSYLPRKGEKREDVAILQCYLGVVLKETVGADRSLQIFRTAKRNNPQVHSAIHNVVYGSDNNLESLSKDCVSRPDRRSRPSQESGIYPLM